ncbi:ATP synthase F1 subunit gamma [Candidatus Paracaedibacter symbiosus]|uniref:ATP synthase F1 subunit gamma n=1 Tax=Candidatus Paracaedibacter symbiosus TaxID=244582 RepID=UPI000509A241|nr:ATP synthase F1 subunit gamma [Candidatus Paracaedibacter symbiosus]
MAGLKDLRLRIKSIKSTQKITSAMKMVAAAKLRKAQDRVQKARPYVTSLKEALNKALQIWPDFGIPPAIFVGRPDVPTELILVVTSDRGLCGGFNVNIVREVKNLIRDYDHAGIPVKLYCIGRKGYELLKRDYSKKILGVESELGKTGVQFAQALTLATKVQHLLEEGVVGKVRAVYSVFKSALNQQITQAGLIPFETHPIVETTITEYEPGHLEAVLALLPQNLASHIYEILLETSASEYGARMTAMDNATRNARDVIQRLELTYNRTRQSVITKELIEIISGAEAL